ncbi:biotin transporter BioY [Liquorilactobacillus satsumensis]|uniref:biotin transporter BioY n=1 Tax=Liquorilactobacillus satsumensis TaxID=259059 RepID=UPI001E3D5971|nr:biotin transporter BioY [Liquorilactobacillus satsumensis]MCC7667082.1 BioY family transporter [Liquorilactobacillus satsumensis]MCP9358260.1 biotin transporter BioY [Liquorilactobacillus satsumensis]MCP9372214.1 biotin transporter BioY [Liquorilactobacillus satsumensis]
MKREKLHNLVLAGILLAVLVVCSQVTIPLPIIPLTLQTFGIGLIASLLPVSYAVEVVLAYLILGAVGLPVFAGFSGGFAALMGPTGGYLVSFVLYALVTAAYLKYRGRSFANLISGNVLGAVVNLLCGSLWMVPVLHLSVKSALLVGLVPFLLPGLIKLLVVALITLRLQGSLGLRPQR